MAREYRNFSREEKIKAVENIDGKILFSLISNHPNVNPMQIYGNTCTKSFALITWIKPNNTEDITKTAHDGSLKYLNIWCIDFLKILCYNTYAQ